MDDYADKNEIKGTKLTKCFLRLDWKDWMRITIGNIIQSGGSGLLNFYGNSLRKALISIYPEHPFQKYFNALEHSFDEEAVQYRNRTHTSRPHTLLFGMMKDIFHNEDVFVEYSFEDLSYSNSKVKVDIVSRLSDISDTF